MSNGHAIYKNAEGSELHLYIEVDLKSEIIQDFRYLGTLLQKYESEFEELKSLILNRTIKDALLLKRSSLQKEIRTPAGKLPLASLSLWLLHKAIEDYLGTATTLNEQNDLLCLCFGVGLKELKKQILTRLDYDLANLIAETMATSACGSCRPSIQRAIVDIREKHGRILGLDHSQSNVDKDGHWIKIKGLYPADLLIKLDDLKKVWMEREAIQDLFEINIVKIEGHHLWLRVALADSSQEDSERFLKILAALNDYWRSEMGVLFFLHLAA